MVENVHILGSISDEAAGPSYSVPRLAEALAARGAPSRIFSLGDGDEEEVNGVLRRTFPADHQNVPALKTLGFSRAMHGALKQAAAGGAVLHDHGLWRMPNVYPGRVARKAGVPLIVSPRGMLGEAALQFSARKKQLFWTLAQKQGLRPVSAFHATADSEVTS